MADQPAWVVYLMLCRGGRLYCGITTDLASRWAAHVAGKGARFTRAFPPVSIVAATRVAARGEALSLEAQVKRQRREAKRSTLLAAGTPLDDAVITAFTG